MGKKSLPILYGLEKGGLFAKRWEQGPIRASEVHELARQLEDEGARAFTRAKVEELTTQALAALDQAQPQAEAGGALRQLALRLVQRQA